MSTGHTIAVAAVPFFDLLDRELVGLVREVNEADDERGVATAMQDCRRRLASAVDAFVRALPAAIRNDPNQSRAGAYALVGLADERMLHYAAGGLERWRDHLLEFDLYGSALAGQEIVRAAQVAAQGGSQQGELGVLYLALLREGFEGSLRGDTHGLNSLAASLEEAVGVDRNSSMELLGEGGPKRTGVAPVPFAIAGVVLWLLAGFGVWLTLPSDAMASADRLVEGVRIGLPASTRPTIGTLPEADATAARTPDPNTEQPRPSGAPDPNTEQPRPSGAR